MGQRKLFFTRPVRRATAGLVVFGLVVSTGAGYAIGGGVASAEVSAPAIDLSNPTANLNDPAGGLAYVHTECQAGQIDINTASAAAIEAALNLPSDPTVNRLIAMRPWLKGSDLSSVPGIGPSVATAIAPHTCATQPVLPTPTPMACISASQVDLNTAPPGTIASRLGLPLSTAQQIVSVRPLPQDLSQIVAPRVPGLSGPTLAKLEQANRICVTPSPMLAGGAAWRWATPAGGAEVGRDGFSLIVPPGRITDPSGDWISVTPLGDDSDGLPSMDASIHGNWNVGTTSVAVQGPWVGTDPSERPAVFHDAASGETLSLGDGAAISTVNGAPTITSLVYSLSTVSYGATICSPSTVAPGAYPSPFCLQNLTDGSIHNAWLAQAADQGETAASTLIAQAPCVNTPTGNSTASMSGTPQPGLGCGLAVNPVPWAAGTAVWDISNRAYASLLDGVASAGVVFDQSAADPENSPTIVGGAEGNPLLDLILNKLGHDSLLFPGQAVQITEQPGFYTSTLNANVDIPATAGWSAIEALVGQLFQAGGPQASLIYQDIQTGFHCGGNAPEAGDCVLNAIELAIKAELARASAGSVAKTIFGGLDKVFAVISAGEIAASVTSSFILAYQGHGGTSLSFTNIPNQPTTDAEGRAVIPACLTHDNTQWHVNETCQNNFYNPPPETNPGGPPGSYDGTITNDSSTHEYVLFRLGGSPNTAYAIYSDPNIAYDVVGQGGTPDQALYDCLARRMPLRDWLPIADLGQYGNEESATPAVCDSSSPQRSLPSNATNWILRQSDGTSYLLDGSSVLHPIPDGGTYICLAQHYYVLDDTTDAEVGQFSTSTTAACPAN